MISTDSQLTPLKKLRPVDAFNIFYKTAGGTNVGLGVCQELVKEEGQKPIDEARKAAERGVLSTASEWIAAGDFDPSEKIKLLNEAAVTTQRVLLKKQQSNQKGDMNEFFVKQAIASVSDTMEYLTASK